MKDSENIHILIVEDDSNTASAIKKLLETKFASEVEVAVTCESARDALSSGSFDIITLDYKLPDGDGLQLLQEITAMENHPPVVMVTGQGDESIASRSFVLGASGYVVKDNRLHTMLPEAVENALKVIALRQYEEALHESEAFYRTLFEQSSDAKFIETVDGVIEDANNAACEMLGYTMDELKGKEAFELVPPEMRDLFEQAVSRLIAGETIEFESIRNDGSRVPTEVLAQEVITRRGPRFVVTTRDITERKTSKAVIEEEKSLTESALNTLDDIFAVFDLDGSYKRWNKRFNEVTGYSDEEISSMKPQDFSPSEYATSIAEAIDSIVHKGPTRFETEIVTKDGRRLPYELSGAPVKDHNGNPVAISATGRDISDRKRTEEALHNVVRETIERREEITALLESTRLVLEQEDYETAFQAILDMCRKLVGAKAGLVSLLSKGESVSDRVLIDSGELLESMEPDIPMPIRGLRAEAYRTGETVFENDFLYSEWAEYLPEGQTTFENVLFAPLTIEGKVEGLIALINKPGGFTNRDAQVANAFAEIASLALRNHKMIEMLSDSEARFRTLAETANDAIISSDSDGSIILWNKGAEVIFGYKADEIMGKSIVELVPGPQREANLEMFTRVKGGAHLKFPWKTYEQAGLKKDGSEFPLELSRATWKFGDELCFTFIMRDISERKRAEEALLESRELYKSLLLTSPDAVAVTDLDGTITYVSLRAIEMYGAESAGELIGKTAFELIEPEDHEKIGKYLEKTLKQGISENMEYTMFKVDGTPFTGGLNATLLRDKNGEPKAMIATIRDVTERKTAERELKALNTELEGYAHTVSHDLKGPLSAIKMASATLQNVLKSGETEDLVSGIDEIAEAIEENVSKSNALIENLLELAEVGQKPLDVSCVNVAEIVKRVLAERAMDIEKKGIKVKFADDLGQVNADATHIYQLFSNLIDNAIKHNDNPTPFLEIILLEDDGKGRRRYLVEDNGSGIDQDDIDKIFLPFYAGSKDSTGIGLATVAKIVKVYNGEINAYNDKGACFEVAINDIS